MLVAVLVVATAGAVAWVGILRPSPQAAHDFLRVEQRFAASARAVSASTDQIVDVGTLQMWNDEVQIHLTDMGLELARLRRIRTTSDGNAREIADAAVSAATSVEDLVVDYRDEVNNGALGTASGISDAIETLLTKLDEHARAWKKL